MSQWVMQRLTTLAAALAATSMASGRAADGTDDMFESRIRPIFAQRCEECHGGTLAESGLRLDSHSAILAGGDSGPVVKPGDPQASPLVAAVRQSGPVSMPPDGRLTDEEIGLLEAWVETGATGPHGLPAAALDAPDRKEAMAARIAEARASHWSFTPPQRHDPPATAGASRIDGLVAVRLAAAGVQPAAPADPRTLVRRLWFDLTGLPPPADEVDAFAAAPTEEAYRGLVDRLLASPEHAEHWARKWLDIARYADTPGYTGADVERPRYPFAWTYRDWVVSSLAADMPLDRFVVLQLAADQCQADGRGADVAAIRADLAALGFLRVGRQMMSAHDMIDDAIDVVTRGLMGLTVGCARCHDHKYEPIGSDDYYALHGVFASTTAPEEAPVIGPADPGPAGAAFAAKQAALTAAVEDQKRAIRDRVVREAIAHAADYLLEVARPAPRGDDGRPPRMADGYELEPRIVDRLGRQLAKAGEHHPVLGPWNACAPHDDVPARLAAWFQSHAVATGAANRLVAETLATEQPKSLAELAAIYGRLAAEAAPAFAGGREVAKEDPPALTQLRAVLGATDSPLVPSIHDAVPMARQKERGRLASLEAEVTDHEFSAPGGPPRAMAIADRSAPVDSHVFLRGDPRRPGPLVERRLPLVLGGRPLPRDASGRLELGRAIVAADNPLTPRVLVNWAWLHHFGRGLVDTPGDLGLRGEPPVNGDLLDDLARRFVDEGRWSLRWLHREIVTSRTWRQSSRRRPELDAVDPDGRLFARAIVRRLDWEPWRDALLTAAGSLVPARRGGQPVELDAESAASRRTIYIGIDRQFLPGLMRTFDMTATDICTHVRTRTLVPQQSLAALNAPLMVAAARGLAARARTEAGDGGDTARVRRTWRAALSRDPAADELAAAVVWLGEERERSDVDAAFGPWERLAQAVLATAEFEHVD